jgi:hypothetical protein
MPKNAAVRLEIKAVSLLYFLLSLGNVSCDFHFSRSFRNESSFTLIFLALARKCKLRLPFLSLV